jgi:hypothetical protein
LALNGGRRLMMRTLAGFCDGIQDAIWLGWYYESLVVGASCVGVDETCCPWLHVGCAHAAVDLIVRDSKEGARMLHGAWNVST